MTLWLIKRVLQALFIILLMTVIVFIGLHAVGNPIDILIGPDADQRDRARIIAQMGLDKPLWLQYFHFLGSAVQGDLGNSFVYNQPALQLVLHRLPATMELALAALVIAIVVGVPLGLIAGLYSESIASRTIMTGSILGFSLPTFWVGLVLIMAFSVSLGWLPSS
ncbi:MAG TPA: ABC transporter permease, partial [Advenella sp.]|nr:ABC transporter permease [Advenella sp.]